VATLIKNIEQFLRQNTLLTKLIVINIAVFLLFRIIGIVDLLFGLNTGFIQYFEFPSSIRTFLHQPWTILTYMFSHYSILHILFNMLWLYWFGKIFLHFFNPKQLGGLYILGGLAGALLFALSYNIFPYFRNMADASYLIGASASVMAIVFGAAFYKKDYTIGLLFLGNIKIIYLALITLVIDILAIDSSNAGGHIAHIGGALVGIAYSYYLKRGTDITAGLNAFIDKTVNLFKRKPVEMKATQNKRFESDYEYNARKNEHNREIDEILDKIKKSGYNSLSKEEKKKLFDASKK
jgi:Uncharacterized membrane protein (homolog of Drosophila rhomboid)